MTSHVQLTVVIPACNAAPWLDKCLASIAALDPAPDEIIVVDDASTDDTPTILVEFSRRYPALRSIRLNTRSGASAARNRGLDEARGKYLAFIDADDFFLPDRFRDALVIAEQDMLDMVFLNATVHHEGRKSDHPLFRQPHSTAAMSGREWLKSFLRTETPYHSVWLHIYRTDYLRNLGLRFPVGITHEDVIWTTEVLLHAQRMRYLPNAGYFYRIPVREFDHATNQVRLEFVVRSSIVNALRLAELVSAEADADLRRLLSIQLVDGALAIFHKIEKMPDRQKAELELLKLRKTGFLALLWRHASDSAQRRRIARHWLRSWLAGAGK